MVDDNNIFKLFYSLIIILFKILIKKLKPMKIWLDTTIKTIIKKIILILFFINTLP